MTWFRVGGPAEVLFRPADARRPRRLPARRCRPTCRCTVLGVGSNLLVRDGGVPGVVDPPGARLRRDRRRGRRAWSPAPARSIVNVALSARATQALAGLEFLSGIPGTIGGAVAMNAGAYGGEIADVPGLRPRRSIAHGERAPRCRRRAGLRYRHAAAAGRLDLHRAPGCAPSPASRLAIAARMAEIRRRARAESQPVRAAPAARPSAIRPATRPGS